MLSGFFDILLSLREAMVIIASFSKHTAFSLSARRWALITATHWCIGRGWSPWCSTTPTLGPPAWGPTQRPIWRRRSNSTGNSCPKVSPPISPCQKVNPPIYCLNHQDERGVIIAYTVVGCRLAQLILVNRERSRGWQLKWSPFHTQKSTNLSSLKIFTSWFAWYN